MARRFGVNAARPVIGLDRRAAMLIDREALNRMRSEKPW